MNVEMIITLSFPFLLSSSYLIIGWMVKPNPSLPSGSVCTWSQHAPQDEVRGVFGLLPALARQNGLGHSVKVHLFRGREDVRPRKWGNEARPSTYP